MVKTFNFLFGKRTIISFLIHDCLDDEIFENLRLGYEKYIVMVLVGLWEKIVQLILQPVGQNILSVQVCK